HRGLDALKLVVDAGQGDGDGLLGGLVGGVDAGADAADDLGQQVDGTGEQQAARVLALGVPLEQRIQLRGVQRVFKRALHHHADRALGYEALEHRPQHGHALRAIAVSSCPAGSYQHPWSHWKGWWGEVKVWDAATGQDLLSLRGHTHVVFSVAYSPD